MGGLCELWNVGHSSNSVVDTSLVVKNVHFPYAAAPSGITPTVLDPANIPVCCAGVQLLEDPSIQVQVLVDGTLHPANQVAREGSFLYIMGLQAGTEYSLNITLSNIFGTAWINTTVRPLLGELVLACSHVHRVISMCLPPPIFLPHSPELVLADTCTWTHV